MTNTTTPNSIKTLTTGATESSKIHVTTNLTYSEKTINEILDCLEDIETFMILIFAQIVIVLIVKLAKMCKRGYKIHNESIIQRHSRQSPQI